MYLTSFLVTHAHTHTLTHAHAHTHARTYTHTHARTHTHTHTQHNSGPHRRINGETTDASLKVSELQIGDEDFQDDGELQDEYHQDNDFQDGNVAEGESESDVDSIQDNQLQDNQVQNSDSQAQDGQAQDGQGQDSQEEGIPGDINNDGAHQNELQESPSNADTQEAQSMPDAAGKGEAPEKAATSKKESLQQPGAITLSKSNLKKEPERLPPPKPAVDQQSIRETRAAQPKQGTMVSRPECGAFTTPCSMCSV